MRRGHLLQAEESKICYFYAPLTQDLVPQIAHDNVYTVYGQAYSSVSSDGLYLSGGSHYVKWNCSVPTSKNLTFSCWLKYTGQSGVGYSFGATTQNNARYIGLQYANHIYGDTHYWLMTEYLYFLGVSYNTYGVLFTQNVDVFITWTLIFNDNNTITLKFYKNGTLSFQTTMTPNGNWNLNSCIFGISHGTNTMYGYYKHFSCYEALTDEEVAQLYQRGGLPE